jgi:radial spoke head protein 9
MTANHQVRRNEAFCGLSAGESLQLQSYVHFRNVQHPVNKNRLDEPSAPFNKYFLESIAMDAPSGCWNFQHDLSKDTVVGRSLLWGGYHFYHLHGQNKFGSIYIGDGLKNLQLAFQT